MRDYYQKNIVNIRAKAKNYQKKYREKYNLYSKQYYARNKEHYSALAKRYASRLTENIEANRRIWYLKNREKFNGKNLIYRTNNREKINKNHEILWLNNREKRNREKELSRKHKKDYKNHNVFRLTGHSPAYFRKNKEQVISCCKLQADEIAQKQNKTLLESKEKFLNDKKKLLQLDVLRLTGHSEEYFQKNREEVINLCKLKVDKMKRNEHRAFLDAKENLLRKKILNLENSKCQSPECIEITDDETETYN